MIRTLEKNLRILSQVELRDSVLLGELPVTWQTFDEFRNALPLMAQSMADYLGEPDDPHQASADFLASHPAIAHAPGKSLAGRRVTPQAIAEYVASRTQAMEASRIAIRQEDNEYEFVTRIHPADCELMCLWLRDRANSEFNDFGYEFRITSQLVMQVAIQGGEVWERSLSVGPFAHKYLTELWHFAGKTNTDLVYVGGAEHLKSDALQYRKGWPDFTRRDLTRDSRDEHSGLRLELVLHERIE